MNFSWDRINSATFKSAPIGTKLSEHLLDIIKARYDAKNPVRSGFQMVEFWGSRRGVEDRIGGANERAKKSV